MQGGARVIVLDEVTAALPSPDAARVHKSIRAAKAAGVAFIYVSHRLEEVFDLCDRMTVLRDGRNVASAAVKEVSSGQVIEWIAGNFVATGRRPSGPQADAPIRLRGEGLDGRRRSRRPSISTCAPARLSASPELSVRATARSANGCAASPRRRCGTVLVDETPVALGSTRRCARRRMRNRRRRPLARRLSRTHGARKPVRRCGVPKSGTAGPGGGIAASDRDVDPLRRPAKRRGGIVRCRA